MLARADIARAVTSLDRQDLRRWHYVLTGGVLTSLSPYGFDVMTGRWAYLSDFAAGSRGRAAAAQADPRGRRDRPGVGGVAARPVQPDPRRCGRRDARPASGGFRPGQARPAQPGRRLRPDQDRSGRRRSFARARPGQILFERATSWPDPPRVTADVGGLLGQTIIAPWAAQIRRLDDGTADQRPADDRPIEAIAADIAYATPLQDEGDDNTPPDPDESLRRFAGTVTSAGTRERDGGWLGGIREYIPDVGPVPGSRFL